MNKGNILYGQAKNWVLRCSLTDITEGQVLIGKQRVIYTCIVGTLLKDLEKCLWDFCDLLKVVSLE